MGAKLIGDGLQRRNVAHRQKRVVVLAKADLGAIELLFNEAVAVEVVCCLERKERAHAHHDRTQHFIADVKIVVGEAAALKSDNSVIGVLAGYFGTVIRKVGPTSRLLKIKYTP